MLTEKAILLLEARHIDVEIAVRMGIESVAPAGGNETISIPYVVAGRVVNHKYRTIEGEKRFWQDQDAPKVFWNVDILGDQSLRHEPLVIVEGEPDGLTAIQCGYLKTISPPDGAPAERIMDPDASKYTYLDAAGYLRGEDEIILATDADRPGRNLMADLAVRLGPARCKWVEYPDGCKDLNEVMREHGADGVRRALRTARWYRVSGVGVVEDFAPVPSPRPFSTGMRWLDDHYRVRLGDFTVVTGIPGHGKTTWLCDLACRMADEWGWTVCHASFEQPPRPAHQDEIRRWKSLGKWDNLDDEARAEIDAWISRSFCFISPVDDDDDDCDFDLDWLLVRLSTAVIRYGARLIVIDPWNEIEHAKPPGQLLTEYVGAGIRRLKRFARRFNVHLIVVAHPTKMRAEKGGRLPIPTLYDIADSAHWGNKPDIGIVIDRDRTDALGRTMLKVAKSRDERNIGKPGVVWMKFNAYENRFEEAPAPDDLHS